MKTMKFSGLLILGGLLLWACAAQNPALQRAITDYTAAAADENVVRYAPLALENARTSLDEAKKVTEEADVNSLSYVTSKRVEIARLDAQRKMVEVKIAQMRTDGKEQILGTLRQNEMDELNRQKSDLAAQKSALEKELADLKAKSTIRGLEMTFPEGALFEVGKSDLKPGAERQLANVAKALKANPDRMVMVEGHTDSSGSDALNLQLSDKRATSVANYLETQGIPEKQIYTKGYGKSFPIASNKTPSGRQQNRRVEMVILKAGETPAKYERKMGG